jgi:predicted RNase H-like HicB family nuclease
MTHDTNPITIEKEDLPGVYGVGTSMEEAKTGILDAILIYLVQRKKAGHALPL